jgi:hypothetical protein
MLIPGHIGFTFGVCFTFSNFFKIPLNLKTLGIIALVSLVPDIMDKGIHLLIPRYPDHAIFHSMFLYGIFCCIVMILRKWTAAKISGILIFNSALDLVNNEPGILVYPLTGFIDRNHLSAPVGDKILERLPQIFSVKDFTGHYLLFEISGLLLITITTIAVFIDNKKSGATAPDLIGCRKDK